jgi:hypothetical protein
VSVPGPVGKTPVFFREASPLAPLFETFAPRYAAGAWAPIFETFTARYRAAYAANTTSLLV